MQQTENINELAEALAKAQGQMEHAKKGAVNSHFRSNYADLAEIVTALRKALSDNGLAYMQTTMLENGGVVLVTTLAHKDGQWIRSFYPVKPTQETPQGFGSAMTYARRYSLAAIAGVAAEGEDDDGNEGSGLASNATPSNAEPSEEVAAFKAMVAQAHAMQGLNDFERKFVTDQHERIAKYGNNTKLPSDKQMAVLKGIVDKKDKPGVTREAVNAIMDNAPPKGHPALDDGIPY